MNTRQTICGLLSYQHTTNNHPNTVVTHNPMHITEVLESHSQPLSNEELYDFAQQLTEQQKEDENEQDRGTKEMQTKDLTDILSAIDMAAEKLWGIDPDWECSSTVKRGIRTMLTLSMKSRMKRRKNRNS